MPNPTVAVVIVAYNRRDLLGEALAAVAAQSVRPAWTVVVDNASTDGTSDLVREIAPDARLIRLERNTGGAGGFAVGMRYAVEELGAEWVWVMDDDTIPTPTALAELLRAVDASPFVLAGSRVVWHDASDHPMNTPRRRPFASAARRERAATATPGGFPVRSSSFVSMLVRADEIRRVGLPVIDYFIWNDDFEFSTRVLRRAEGVFVPQSVVVHKTARLASTDDDPGERFYYEVRNKLWMLRASDSLAPHEKLLYGGSTLLRWVRTLLRSPRRDVLRAAFRRGWKDGWHSRPRSNAEALADLGTVSAEVARFESSVRGARG